MRVVWLTAILASISTAAPAAAAPAEPPAEPAPPVLSDLPDGTYWVRRVVRTEGGGVEGFGADGPGEMWTDQRTQCQRFELYTTDSRRRLRIGNVELLVVPAAGGWKLHNPTLSTAMPPLELSAPCVAKLTVGNAPIHADRDSCNAVPPRSTRRCRGDVCRYEGEAPFLVPECERVMAKLATDAAVIRAASHTESMRSVERLLRIARGGGRLWVDAPEEERCHPMTLRPRRDGGVAVRQSFAVRAGGIAHYEAEVTLEPLFHTAHFKSEARWFDGGGGGGGYGIGAFTAGLYAGKDVLLVNGRWMYFDRATCEAASRP